MNKTIKQEKETAILQHLGGLFLQSNIPATYVEAGNNCDDVKELVHALYLRGEDKQKISVNYYFKQDENSNDYVFVSDRYIIPDVKTIDGKLDVNYILEILEAYNYLATDGTFVLEGDVINYRSTTVIAEGNTDDIIYYQLKKMISNEVAISEKIEKIIATVSNREYAA